MRSDHSRPKPLESVLSILMLVILLIIASILLLMQSHFDIGRFGVEAEAVPTAVDTDKETGPLLADLVPDGFEKLSDIESYTAENLYEKINGKAPMYTEAGFENLSTIRFTSKTNPDLWMEIFVYDMGKVANAFSVYSVQRRAEAQDLSKPNTYITSNGLFLAHGRFYVELVGSAQSEELIKAMIETAEKIQTGFAVEQTPIAELNLLSAKNIVPGSIKLYLANAFGFEGLNNIFTAKYKINGDSVTAFLSSRPDIEEAEATAQSYRKFLIENGAAGKIAINKTMTGGIFDFYGTTEIVLTSGPFIIGVHEAETQLQAEKLAEQLLSRITQQSKAAEK